MNNGISRHIDEKLSGLAADEKRRTRISTAIREEAAPKGAHKVTFRAVLAFSLATVLLLSVTAGALAYAIPDVNDLLYRIWPWAAQKLKPVCLVAEDQGIRMEVISAEVQKNEAWVYLSLRDLEGDRLDETADLFDSGRLQLPYDGSGTCVRTGYDPETGAVQFLVYMQFDTERVEDGNVTFSVSRILSGKKTEDVDITSMIDPAREAGVSLPEHFVNGGGGTALAEIEASEWNRLFGQVPVLIDANEPINITEGIEMDGSGVAEGILHVRIRGKDNRHTDNHCTVMATDREGNTLSRGMILCSPEGEPLIDVGSIGWNEGEDQITEWLFELPDEGMEGLTLVAECVTAEPAIEGDWSVTFPLESIRTE